ncbi:MAG: hypothetical protein KDI13_08535 [Alphaproteobacteria bacterium]|nr:hypothetical protein [Alphaproteobacteria bacterium]
MTLRVFTGRVFVCVLLLSCFVFYAHDCRAEDGPKDILGKYVAALESGDSTLADRYYSEETYKVMEGRRVSVGMMAREAQTIKACGEMLSIKDDAGNLAVVVFPYGPPTCSPYFFLREGRIWRLDFAAMMQVIRFDQSNRWRIDKSVKNPYSFAFETQ